MGKNRFDQFGIFAACHVYQEPMNSDTVASPSWLIPSRFSTFSTVIAILFMSGHSDQLSPYSAFKLFRVFIAKGSLISLCRGTASMVPVLEFIHRECDPPSLLR